MGSIRSFLTLALVGSIVLSILVAIGASYQRITHETEELYDAELAQIARVLEAMLAIQFDYSAGSFINAQPVDQKLILPPEIHSDEEYDSSGHKYEKKLSFQAWSRKGVPLLGSQASGSMLSFNASEGYAEESINGQAWRTFVLFSDQLSIWIKVGQLVEIRNEITEEVAAVYIAVPLIVLPLIVLLITLIVRKGLSPLKEINQEISERNTSYLRPLNLNRIPTELEQVVESVNNLMFSLEQALERQKRFTSNAAHELRTPLAAIKIHAQNIYPDSERLQKIQDNIVLSVDKLTHLFNQLITLSQMENHNKTDQQTFPLSQLVEELIQSMQQHINERQITLDVDIGPQRIRANRDALEVLLRNLIDNAIKYTPTGGSVKIEVDTQNDDLTLLISDSGPGLNPKQRTQVFERFYRTAGQDTFGCGIGLSIVKELCDQSGYAITIEDSIIADSGLTVIVQGIQSI
ncbi:MAG: ATP-binding protein [Neptuniibacter sp.]